MDLKALVAKQRDALADLKTKTVEVVLGGEAVEVVLAKVSPDEWQELAADHPPRKTNTGDHSIGYDQYALPRDYPADRITVGGEAVDQEQWAEIYSVLEAVHRNSIGSLIWGLNVLDVMEELQRLGKAAAGRRSASPANRESRRAASKGASRQK